jgi:phosphatidylserine/phosphatidylglycerophosphate/cardiolipin synthase-like enzyme
MAEVLNTLLQQHSGHSLDVATAYFNVGGWHLLHKGLDELGNFRLLLGEEPEAGFDLGLREVGAKPVKGLIRDLASASFNEHTLRLVEDFIAFFHRGNVQVRLYTQGFLHAKCYLFYSGGGFERFNPVAAIVGSSNFTRAGLLSNKELNLAHRANLSPEEVSPERVKGLLESSDRKLLGQVDEIERVTAANVPGVLAINELAEWYERQWQAARDFKGDLIDLLDASKFGRKEYRHHPELCVQVGGKLPNRAVKLTNRSMATDGTEMVPHPHKSCHQKKPCPSGKSLVVLLVLPRAIGKQHLLLTHPNRVVA